jgi:hypothetical protein
VAFNRKPAGDSFLVSTNFNLANPSSGNYPCWRYSRAEEMLAQIQGQDGLTAEHVASIMEAVHVDDPSNLTVYSVVADLRQRMVYVYYLFQYDAPITLSIDEEIARSQPPRPLSELFPEETQRQASRAYEWLMARSTRCDAAGLAWLGIVVVSLISLVLMSRSRGQGLVFWVPVVAVLGPVGLLAWLFATRGRLPRTLVETLGDLPPYPVGMVIGLLGAILVPAIGQNGSLVLIALYGIPLAVGLFYQALLLAWSTRSSFVRSISGRLPTLLVSTNLTLAGLLAIALPVTNWQTNHCGLGTFAILQWWVIAVLGASVGGLLLYVYQAWAIRHGFTAWSALLEGLGEVDEGTTAVSSPSWRRLWLWILLSFVVLIAGVALGVLGTALTSNMR